MRRVVLSSRAESEIAEATLWYEQQRAGLGRELLAEFDAICATIMENPLLKAPVRRAPDVRCVLLGRFPWHLWYYLEGDTIRIFAFLHAKRNPGTWKEHF